jgi:hypothetical protein
MNCTSCGSVIAAGQKFCDDCGTPVVAVEPALGAFGSEPYPVPVSGGAAGTLPGTPIVLGDGEVLWRRYHAVQLRSRSQGEGVMFVTDARVVLYAYAKGRGTQRPSSLVQQVKLEHVTGVTAAVSRRISLLLIGFTVLIGLFTLSELAKGSFGYGFIAAVITAFCVWRLVAGAANRGTVAVVIQAGAQGHPIGFGHTRHVGSIARFIKAVLPFWLYRILGVFTAEDVLGEGEPGIDSDRLVAELGALIFDLQTRGNLADTHWGVTTDQSYGRALGEPAL